MDEQDTNTYDQYEGQSVQMTLQPWTTINKGNILLKNLTEKRLVFARAKRKETLTAIEQIAAAIYDVVAKIHDFIANFLNGIAKFIQTIVDLINLLLPGSPLPPIPTVPLFPPNPFLQRIGMMLLSNDFIGVPKLLVIENSPNVGNGVPPNAFNLRSNNGVLTSAAYLIDNYHIINFAIQYFFSNGTPVQLDHNQYLIFKDKQIPLCCNDFVNILNNNFVTTHDQKLARVDSLVWNPFKQEARINFRVKQLYTSNLFNTYVIDGL